MHDDESYPDDYWLDFGSIVLGWWIVSATKLLSGEGYQQFPFMDGPFGLTVRHSGDLLYITGKQLEKEWMVPLHTFITEIIQASETVIEKLTSLNISDNENLVGGISILKRLLVTV